MNHNHDDVSMSWPSRKCVSTPPHKPWSLSTTAFSWIFVCFWRTHSHFGATGTHVLDFWWRLLWVSKPEWVLPYSRCSTVPEIDLWCYTLQFLFILAHLIHRIQMCYCYQKLENQSKSASFALKSIHDKWWEADLASFAPWPLATDLRCAWKSLTSCKV